MKKLFLIVTIIAFMMMTVSPISAGPDHRGHYPRHHSGHHSGHHDSWAAWAVGALTGAVIAILFFLPLNSGVNYQPPPAAVAPPPPMPQGSVISPGIGQVSVGIYALNVRSGPGLHYSIDGYVSRGDTLVIHHHVPGWLYVQLPSGRFGWVIAEFTTPIPTPAFR